MQGKYGDPPHILVMTETKLINLSTKNKLPWFNMLHRTHHIIHSAIPDTNSPQAGVTIAINKTMLETGTIRRQRVEAALDGFMIHMTLELPASNPLHIIGVYCPTGYKTPTRTWCPVRLQIQKECSRILSTLPETHHTVILAGDFNAVLQAQDRLTASKPTGDDQAHQQFISANGLYNGDPPSNPGLPRTPTCRKLGGVTPCSRIDDILANINTCTHKHAHAWVVDLHGTTTDHDMMCFEAPFKVLKMQPPPLNHQRPAAPATIQLKTPLSATHSLLLHTHIAESQGMAYAALNAETTKYVQEDVRPHWAALTKTYADRPALLTTLPGWRAGQTGGGKAGGPNHPTADTL
jgi:hypothetical protein